MAYLLKSLEPWDVNSEPLPDKGRTAVGSISLSCTLIRTTCIPKGFQFTGQPNVVDGQPAGRRGHEFSLWKAMAMAGHKIGADYDLKTEHRVLTEVEPLPQPPPPRRGLENFCRSNWCVKRRVCKICRDSQTWRDVIRQQYSVPDDFDHQCPNGLKSGERSLPEMAMTAMRAIGQAAGAVAAGRPVLAQLNTVEERWKLCTDCKDYYDPDLKRCRSCGCFLEVKILLSFSACDLGRWKAEDPNAPAIRPPCKGCQPGVPR